jgi:ketosteroid isomerase-like protein
MTSVEIVTKGYELWDASDADGFLALFDDDARFAIPGATPVSGDHDKQAFRKVLQQVFEATRGGRHRQELICRYYGDSGVVSLFDNYVGEGMQTKYHSVHEWIIRDGTPVAWMLYLHEYDVFASNWS